MTTCFFSIFDSSDADPPVLTEYVIALLSKHNARNTVEKDCLKELHEFMKDKTNAFVKKMFEIVEQSKR